MVVTAVATTIGAFAAIVFDVIHISCLQCHTIAYTHKPRFSNAVENKHILKVISHSHSSYTSDPDSIFAFMLQLWANILDILRIVRIASTCVPSYLCSLCKIQSFPTAFVVHSIRNPTKKKTQRGIIRNPTRYCIDNRWFNTRNDYFGLEIQIYNMHTRHQIERASV